MAVVAIIAILALMAVPSYHDKFIREQVVEAMRLTDIAKGPIARPGPRPRRFPRTTRRRACPHPTRL